MNTRYPHNSFLSFSSKKRMPYLSQSITRFSTIDETENGIASLEHRRQDFPRGKMWAKVYMSPTYQNGLTKQIGSFIEFLSIGIKLVLK